MKVRGNLKSVELFKERSKRNPGSEEGGRVQGICKAGGGVLVLPKGMERKKNIGGRKGDIQGTRKSDRRRRTT